MDQITRYTVSIARILMSAVFVLNGFGIIDQQIPAREMMQVGMPPALVPAMMMAGRSVEVMAGFALALGVFPRIAAIALVAFLIPATFISHSFWLSVGTPAFQGQLINFCKNVAIWGGLFFIAGSPRQPSLLRDRITAQFHLHQRGRAGAL
jgi:putative oxidoreductase